MTMTETEQVGATTKRAHQLRRELGAGERIFVAELNGEPYASNSYWLVPLSRVSALFTETPERGTYVTGSNDRGPAVERTNDIAPNFNGLGIAKPSDTDHELERVLLEGHAMFIPCRTPEKSIQGYAAPLYRFADGSLGGFDPAFIELMVGSDEYGYPARFKVTQGSRSDHGRSTDGTRPCAVWRATRATYLNGHAVDSWRLAGFLMPIRCQS